MGLTEFLTIAFLLRASSTRESLFLPQLMRGRLQRLCLHHRQVHETRGPEDAQSYLPAIVEEKLVKAWVDQYAHFGNVATSGWKASTHY
ncbi:hypothetical protein HRG_014861 [Hirsutella rhossiliensis]